MVDDEAEQLAGEIRNAVDNLNAILDKAYDSGLMIDLKSRYAPYHQIGRKQARCWVEANILKPL